MASKLRCRSGLIVVSLAAVLSCHKSAQSGSAASSGLTPEVEHPSVAPPLSDPALPTATAAARESDPTAGSWRTVLLGAPSDIPVPPPPSGRAEQREIEELRRRAATRDELALRSVTWWDAGSVRRWNEIARGLASRKHLNSCQGARMFALLAAAQHDSLVTTWHYKYLYKRPAPTLSAGFRPAHISRRERYSYPSEDAAVAAASAAVLSYIASSERDFLWRNAEADRDSRLWAGTNYPSDVKAGYEVGLAVAERARKRGDEDGSAKAHLGAFGKEPGKWWAEPQILPGWGKVKPWLMKAATDFRAPEPPAAGSAKFESGIREVRAIAEHRTAEQLLLAQYWDLGVGAISVPGMWDQIGLDAMSRASFSEPRMSRALALANIAMMDASIACWETKYHYRVPRPTMIDAKVETVMQVPPHPSYTSGHAAFSGAAAAVFSYVLPEKARWFDELAQQAAMSRLYGGIHTRLDDDEGLKQGRAVATLAIERGRRDGCPPL